MRQQPAAIGIGLAVLLGGAAPAAAAGDPAFGYWLVENRRAIVELHGCGVELCGRIAWLAEPFNPDGSAKTDLNNPDPAMRTQTLCGLALIRNLSAKRPGVWDGGEIYNAKDGSTYSVRVMADSDNRLEVRGFLGISLLGKSQSWTRVDDDRGGCTRLARPGRDR